MWIFTGKGREPEKSGYYEVITFHDPATFQERFYSKIRNIWILHDSSDHIIAWWDDGTRSIQVIHTKKRKYVDKTREKIARQRKSL